MTGKRSNSFHQIKTFDLPVLEIDGQYSNINFLADGWYSKIYSAVHSQAPSNPIALKCVNKESTKRKDFFREFHYNYYLSPHPNIVNSYDVAYDSDNAYIFAQELATEGDLSSFVKKGGVGETKSKKIAEQIAFALEFMHSKELVHRDVSLENVLVFEKDLSKIKLGDFGLTQRCGSLVKKNNVRVPWSSPEVCQAVYNEGYHVETTLDSWQLGVLIFVCLTGSYPWFCADITDRHYNSWVAWHKRKTNKLPKRFKCFSPRLLRLFRRLLEPKAEKRARVKEVFKYLQDPWILKGCDPIDMMFDESSSEIFITTSKLPDESHEKHKLVEILRSYGIQTTVDKNETKRRVSEWLMNSVSISQREL